LPLGTLWIWLGVAMFARALWGVSRRTRWIVVGIAVALWAWVTYFMPVFGADDRQAIVLGIALLAVIIGGVIAEVFVTVRQLMERRQRD
jgi:hypothetical protein